MQTDTPKKGLETILLPIIRTSALVKQKNSNFAAPKKGL